MTSCRFTLRSELRVYLCHSIVFVENTDNEPHLACEDQEPLVSKKQRCLHFTTIMKVSPLLPPLSFLGVKCTREFFTHDWVFNRGIGKVNDF